MSITDSLLYPDINPIMTSDMKINPKYTLEVHTMDSDVEIIKVVAIDIVRDYVSAFGDAIYIKAVVGLGTYAKEIYPMKDNLEATITTHASGETTSIRYKALIPHEANSDINPDTLSKYSLDDLNVADVFLLNLQLVHLNLEAITLSRVRGVYKHTDRQTILKDTLLAKPSEITINGISPIDKVIVDEPDNQVVTKQLAIRSHTKLLALPRLLQEEHGGVYSGGIGSYIQNYQGLYTWFVYPLYDPTRFTRVDDKLVVFVVDNQYNPFMDASYSVDGGIVSVVAALSAKSGEDIEDRASNRPYGFRVSDADQISGKPLDIIPGKLLGSEDKVHKEVLIRKRTDELNLVEESSVVITSNFFRASSVVAKNNGYRLDVVWKKSDPALLRPGMSAQIYLEQDGVVQELEGVLLFNHTLYGLEGRGLQTDNYGKVTYMSFFISY